MLPVAFVLLGASRLAILSLPFKHLVAPLGRPHGVAPVVPLVNGSALRHARRIGWVVRTAARWTPWSSNCFAQALTSALLLRRLRIPHAIYFGLTRNDRPHNGQRHCGLDAHAWVAAGPCAVVGGHGFDRFVVVGCWAWAPAAIAARRSTPMPSV